MSSICGKALLVLTRLHTDKPTTFRWDVTAFVQTGGHDFINEDFDLISYDCLPAPDAAYNLKVGETARVYVTYRFSHTKDYLGECDIYLDYGTQRLLKKQKARDYYVSKAARAKEAERVAAYNAKWGIR